MRRIAPFALLAGFSASVLTSAPAEAQATRTWVSGTGDDLAGVCSLTQPCKTFAAAIAVTATNGEIDCLDPGGFGTVTIFKSITIDCSGTFGSILSSGSTAITINIDLAQDPLGRVMLRGLSLNGAAGTGISGARGVIIQSAAMVTLEDMVIMNHAQQGIADLRTAPGKLFIKNSVIRNNTGVGILIAATGGTHRASIENTHSIGNLYGLAIGNGNQVKITRSLFSGNTFAGVEAGSGAQAGVEHSTINFNGTGLQAFGAIWIGDTDVSFNQTAASGSPPMSFGNNRFYANGTPLAGTFGGAPSTDRGQQ
jgi:hypothetical protein